MPLDTGGVNQVHAELPGAIKNGTFIPIPPALLTEDPSDTASDNYGLVGSAARLWNTINGHPCDKTLAFQRTWWEKFFAVRKFMRGEQLSLIYFPHHCDSVIGARGGFKKLGMTDLEAVSYTHLTLPTNREV